MRTGSVQTPRSVHKKPASHPAPRAHHPKATRAPQVDAWQPGGKVLRGGRAQIDLNGTRYTHLEGRAADNRLSIQRPFNPLKEPGIALTTAQARKLGVKVGDSVTIRDTTTQATVRATYYDNAGTKPDGLRHFEVSPALADALGISYRNSRGQVVDAVTNASKVDGRFTIEP